MQVSSWSGFFFCVCVHLPLIWIVLFLYAPNCFYLCTTLLQLPTASCLPCHNGFFVQFASRKVTHSMQCAVSPLLHEHVDTCNLWWFDLWTRTIYWSAFVTDYQWLYRSELWALDLLSILIHEKMLHWCIWHLWLLFSWFGARSHMQETSIIHHIILCWRLL